MATGLDLSCLMSTVKNVSGSKKKFGFLPPHGRELAANEEFTCFGDITEAILRFDRTNSRRNIAAFEAAVGNENPTLEILHTPAPILESPDGTSTKMLQLNNNGSLGVVDPCWITSLSESDAAYANV